MKTFSPKKEDVKRKWYVLDLEGKNLGRAATQIATYLTGKHKPDYAPHIDNGDFVIVTNADKLAVTGNKMIQKMYRRHSGYPGALKETNLKEMLATHPERVITFAVKGMLAKNRLRSRRIKRLKVYTGSKHDHYAQRPEPFPYEE